MFVIYGLGVGEVLVIIVVAVVISFIAGMWAGKKAADADRKGKRR